MSFDEAYANGTFFKPMHHFHADPAGQLRKSEYDKGKWTTTHTMELVWTSKGVSSYLGTYEMSLAKVLSAAEFAALPWNTQGRVWRLSFYSSDVAPASGMDIAAMYESGELQALQISCRRVGLNEELNRLLFEAAAEDQRSDAAPGQTVTSVSALQQSTEPGSVSDNYWSTPNQSSSSSPAEHQADDTAPGQSTSAVTTPQQSTRPVSISDIYSSTPDQSSPSSPLAYSTLQQTPLSAGSYQHALKNYRLSRAITKKEWKILQNAGAIKSDNDVALKIAVVAADYVLSVHSPERGFKLFSKQQVNKKGRVSFPPTLDFYMKAQWEIILSMGGLLYCHFGTYRPVSQRTLGVSEFVSLSPETRHAVYMDTVYRRSDADRSVIAPIEEKYASGEYTAVRVDLERIGLDLGVQRYLEFVTAAAA
ncbi:hypothetical protein H0H81_003504 [Sphagnurus paluster]|uniref:Uncharacterized protein n=1 Tax=Sphagnurus paluster TaxID=117069 RepID=A0A9P7K7X3_9AGAR|nr:hypothetical protein H0H81_003504 [Sphagnurus paluster]